MKNKNRSVKLNLKDSVISKDSLLQLERNLEYINPKRYATALSCFVNLVGKYQIY